jgi:hypothetical protein
MRKGDPEICCGVWPAASIFPSDDLVDPRAQRDAYNEICGRAFGYMFAAVKNKDPWQAIRLLIQAERLVGEYVVGGFERLIPLQEEFRDLLRDLIRVERRVVIRRALLCREKDIPRYTEVLRAWEGPDATEDFWIVDRALKRGGDIFADLRRRCG